MPYPMQVPARSLFQPTSKELQQLKDQEEARKAIFALFPQIKNQIIKNVGAPRSESDKGK